MKTPKLLNSRIQCIPQFSKGVSCPVAVLEKYNKDPLQQKSVGSRC